MALSILRKPPCGSVLASRVAALERVAPMGECSDDTPLELRPHFERAQIDREPRLWKHPTDLVARSVLIPAVALELGAEAAEDLAKHPRMALAFAELIKGYRKATATADERANEPGPDTARTVMIILAEFLRVERLHPEASWDRKCRVTGVNLGGPGSAINRGTIRRIVGQYLNKLFRAPNAELGMLVLEKVPEIMGWYRSVENAGQPRFVLRDGHEGAGNEQNRA